MRTGSIVVGLAALVASAAVAAEPAPFVGEWHWNGAASVGAPGEQKPRDVVLSITSADAAHVAWRLTMIDENGQRHEQSFSGTGDGKSVAVTGNATGSMAAFTVTPTALQAVYTYPDGAADRSTCALSADRKTMTCHGVESDGKGHTAPYTDVYDRK
jgi:hypothetical protein